MKRVAVYAEGPFELGKAATCSLAPGAGLGAELLGPVHVLVERCLQHVSEDEALSVEFIEPLRTRSGKPRGSNLRHARTLRQLLSWPSPERQPDLAVVVVDEDEEPDRKRKLQETVKGLANVPGIAIGVARKEFESWLIVDSKAVTTVLGNALELPQNPEGLPPRAAKEALQRAVAESARRAEEPLARLEIASTCDLAVLQARSSSFQDFLRDLKHPPHTS